MQNMKAILLNNWKAKLACLILATMLWYLVKQNVDQTSGRFELPRNRADEPARALPAQNPTHEPTPKKTLRN